MIDLNERNSSNEGDSLRKLWDHLVKRAHRAEGEPTKRVQHIVNDIESLLDTFEDFCSTSLTQDRKGSKDIEINLGQRLPLALGIQTQILHLKSENEFPTKFRALFAQPVFSNKENLKPLSTFETVFATSEDPSNSRSIHNDNSVLEENGLPVFNFRREGNKFVCTVPSCNWTTFDGLEDLKNHYKADHLQQETNQENQKHDCSKSSSDESRIWFLSSPYDELILTKDDRRLHLIRDCPAKKKLALKELKRERLRRKHMKLRQARLKQSSATNEDTVSNNSESQNVPESSVSRDQDSFMSANRKHMLKCQLCEFTCRNQLDLESHSKTQHPGKNPFICEDCGFRTSEKRMLSRHRRSKHLLNYRCEVCDHRFGYKNHLENHMASHSTENTVMCHLCGKGFKCGKYLRKHLRFTHAEQDAFLCGHCGRSFKHQSSYETHLKAKHPNLFQTQPQLMVGGMMLGNVPYQ